MASPPPSAPSGSPPVSVSNHALRESQKAEAEAATEAEAEAKAATEEEPNDETPAEEVAA